MIESCPQPPKLEEIPVYTDTERLDWAISDPWGFKIIYYLYSNKYPDEYRRRIDRKIFEQVEEKRMRERRGLT